MHVAIIEFRSSTPYPIQLANALSEHCQVSLMLPHTFPSYRDNTVNAGVHFETFYMPRVRYPANLGMMWKLARQVKALKADLVHITAWYPWLILSRFMFAPLPTVSTVHDVNKHPGDAESWPLPPFMYHWQWRGAKQVIVHASTAKKDLLDASPINPALVHVIPIGAYNLYQSLSTEQAPERPNTILFFGRIWAYKGLQRLIEAEPLITREIPDARIVIAGTGEPIEKYEAMMVNKDHFEVLNYRIPDAKVAELFQSASVVALPYLEASQSGVIPVAYAFGKPVVATTVGGIPDIVDEGQTGFLIPPDNVQALADAIIAMLRDPQRRLEMGRKALLKSQQELSWAGIARKTVEVYRKALGAS